MSTTQHIEKHTFLHHFLSLTPLFLLPKHDVWHPILLEKSRFVILSPLPPGLRPVWQGQQLRTHHVLNVALCLINYLRQRQTWHLAITPALTNLSQIAEAHLCRLFFFFFFFNREQNRLKDPPPPPHTPLLLLHVLNCFWCGCSQDNPLFDYIVRGT